MYLDEMQTQTIKRWMDFFESCPLLQTAVTDEVPTYDATTNRFSLEKYNAVQATISLDDGSVLDTYFPYGEDEQQISAIMVSGGTGSPKVSYKYNPFAILTRSSRDVDQSKFKTPRLYVMWSNSVKLPYGRQVNDQGKRVGRRRVYLTIAIDVDKYAGGYPRQAELTDLVTAAIEGNLKVLHSLGFEHTVVEEIPPNENYTKEAPLEINRGILMVAFTIEPIIRR